MLCAPFGSADLLWKKHRSSDAVIIAQVSSRMPLAAVSFRQPVLRAHTALPALMTAGMASLYAVSLKNATPLPQRIGIAMSADTRSFLVAGEYPDTLEI